jgi:Mlc titration factor MtfA (ptsG expression regulator)
LSEHFAAVYQQLQLYYRQNPLHQAMIDHLT